MNIIEYYIDLRLAYSLVIEDKTIKTVYCLTINTRKQLAFISTADCFLDNCLKIC